jgi:hypothetical protein
VGVHNPILNRIHCKIFLIFVRLHIFLWMHIQAVLIEERVISDG